MSGYLRSRLSIHNIRLGGSGVLLYNYRGRWPGYQEQFIDIPGCFFGFYIIGSKGIETYPN